MARARPRNVPNQPRPPPLLRHHKPLLMPVRPTRLLPLLLRTPIIHTLLQHLLMRRCLPQQRVHPVLRPHLQLHQQLQLCLQMRTHRVWRSQSKQLKKRRASRTTTSCKPCGYSNAARRHLMHIWLSKADAQDPCTCARNWMTLGASLRARWAAQIGRNVAFALSLSCSVFKILFPAIALASVKFVFLFEVYNTFCILVSEMTIAIRMYCY